MQLLMVAVTLFLKERICPICVPFADAQANCQLDAVAIRALVRDRLNEQLREQYKCASCQNYDQPHVLDQYLYA